MPYRRLPNTDAARIRTLRTAIEQKRIHFSDNVFDVNLSKMEVMLRNLETTQLHYKNSLDMQVLENKKLQKMIRDARMYISHFIQVLNLSVIRKEIKDNQKELYKLEADNFAVPDLTSNDALIEWGENIINGEQIRTRSGGTPIYNPSIARVNVAISMFKDAYISQKMYQTSTQRYLDQLTEQRVGIDDLICELWNQIEGYYANLPEEEKIEECQRYGVIYYYRKGEKERLEKKKQQKTD